MGTEMKVSHTTGMNITQNEADMIARFCKKHHENVAFFVTEIVGKVSQLGADGALFVEVSGEREYRDAMIAGIVSFVETIMADGVVEPVVD